jgi:hypothetical protein
MKWRALLTARNLALAGGGLLALAAFTSGGAASGQVAKVHAPSQFPHGHGADFARYVVGLLAQRGITGEAAVLFTAHVCRETGSGASIFDYNFGNLGAAAWSGPWYYVNGAGSGRFRAYPTADAGIDDAIGFIRDRNGGRYARAWAMMMAGDEQWYRELGLAGYYGNVTLTRTDPARVAVADQGQADYENILATVRGWLSP